MEDYKELIKDWSQIDKEWLEGVVQENFRPIAAKYGRVCFGWVMQIGRATGACHLIVAHSQHMGNKIGNEVRQATQHLAEVLNDLASATANAHGLTQERLKECKQDIERMGALSMAVPNQKGKIILPN